MGERPTDAFTQNKYSWDSSVKDFPEFLAVGRLPKLFYSVASSLKKFFKNDKSLLKKVADCIFFR